MRILPLGPGTLLLLLAPTAGWAQERPVLPEGPAARALAGVAADTTPRDLRAAAEHLPGLLAAPAPWSAPEAWRSWAEWVEAETAARAPDPARRAALCLLARAHGRHADAWEHLAAAGGDPAWVASALPYLWPGIDPSLPAAAGGRPAPLPNGARLTPLMPPGADEVLRGLLPRAELILRGLEVGEGRVDVRLLLEPIGVEIELIHAGGAPVELEVVLPAPRGFELRVEYVDWLRQDGVGVPRRVTLGAEDAEPRQLFGRFERRREPLPAIPEGFLPAGLELGGLWLAPGPGCGPPELLEAAAQALGRLAGVRSGVLGQPPAADPVAFGGPDPLAFGGIVVHLSPAERGARELARVASAAERWALARHAR